MDHRHILAQKLDGFGENFLPAIYVFHVQKIHRVELNLQIGAVDLVQRTTGLRLLIKAARAASLRNSGQNLARF